uniref:DoxX family protein n=1 Tax=Thermosporothrix sp. COM3 TaxID=2490863 RepID=A0A455ST36_9CHLR|nr:hypothetical protein KTC_62780 [Thermosporothrix sp. COM3]
MYTFQKVQPKSAMNIPASPVVRFLFSDTRVAWLWLLVRLYVGYQWISAGWEKLTGYTLFGQPEGTSWLTSGDAAMHGFIQGALKNAAGAHPAVQSWYAWFLENAVLPNAHVFSYVIPFGEFLVGLGLIVGALTGIAAFFGFFMNLNFLLAGAVSVNPVLAVLSVFLILAWRIAGYYGVDRYLLPLLGTPWTGSLAQRKEARAVEKSKA